jgi:AcrR family transcriptional regulator
LKQGLRTARNLPRAGPAAQEVNVVSSPQRIRSGGRSERVRRAVAQACLDLLAGGEIDFGHQEVAEKAGVSKATVYRWWPARADLLREALREHTARLEIPDTGSWEGDVEALADNLATFFSDPVELGVNAIMAGRSHLELDAIWLGQFDTFMADWHRLVGRALARGEVDSDITADIVALVLTASLLVPPLLLRRSLSPDEVRQVARLIIAGTTGERNSLLAGLSELAGRGTVKVTMEVDLDDLPKEK